MSLRKRRLAQKSKVFLKGEQLLEALAKTITPIKWLNADGSPVNRPNGQPLLLTAAQAILIARAGQYIGKTTRPAKRIYSIREMDERIIVFDPVYWQDRAVLRWRDDLSTKPKRKRVADLWDVMLQRTPPPRSWQR